MSSLPENVSGKYHNDMLGMASDTVLRIGTLPRLMLTMLESEGWRRLERPIDHRIFENHTIADWVLGEPWPGLHFPDWATLYALLDKNIEVGKQCLTRLKDAGAPSREEAEREFRVKAAKDGAKIQPEGRPKKLISHISLPTGGSARLAARLKRDYPDIFAALERGEFRSVRAAAIAAGLIREKTPLDQLRHWWRKASADERQIFRSELGI